MDRIEILIENIFIGAVLAALFILAGALIMGVWAVIDYLYKD